MNWWAKKASTIQRDIVSMEDELPPEALGVLFPPERARQAAVLSRQDLIGAVSMIDSLNAQAAVIKWTLFLIAGLLAILISKL